MPNILTERDRHQQDCVHVEANHVCVGEVRYCPHGHLQIAVDMSNSRVVIITPYWRDIYWFEFITVWHAKRALR